ncbi:MAG: GH3 auxin-responsive promoter family protein [Bacteroidota bacterium]
MSLFGSLVTWYLKKRVPFIEQMMENPGDTQLEVFNRLINQARYTEWGTQYDYKSIRSIDDFKQRVPVGNYETHKPYIDRMMKGEQNLLWPTDVTWFAKSSGTTSAKSKFIPVTFDSLEECHFQGGKDALMFYQLQKESSTIFSGKGLIMGGSHQINRFAEGESYYGDLSAVMMQNMPFWAQYFRTPDLSIAIMDNWDEKIEKMALATLSEDVTSISGVPTWTLVLIDKLFEITGKNNLIDIWPNLELYMHGGVSFVPYEQRFKSLIRSAGMNYLETYNASEGFLGIQDSLDRQDMLLMLDYGIFYEFMPMSEYGKEHPETLSIDEVNVNENYALVISTNAGLWRYVIGDTVRFTSLRPHRFKITGRTKHFINAFGEELVIENADFAMAETCRKFGVKVIDYTAAPVHFERETIGTHEWLIEFEHCPEDMHHFTAELDDFLKQSNSDYEAKRYKDMAMVMPKVNAVARGTFHNWLKQNGKLGGQHKVPRLANNREYIEQILKLQVATG